MRVWGSGFGVLGLGLRELGFRVYAIPQNHTSDRIHPIFHLLRRGTNSPVFYRNRDYGVELQLSLSQNIPDRLLRTRQVRVSGSWHTRPKDNQAD